MSDAPTFPTLPQLGTSESATQAARGGAIVEGLALGSPRRIGPYELTGVLGSGGMGVVYRAEQHEPLRREVALKLIRRGLDTDRLIARFEAERLALARMSHSGIARVLDAGATEDGRPYFVMELVTGSPITEYCDSAGVSLRDRLALFVAACRAVQHAHQKGIVHRDLKPSNILVSVAEGAPSPKIIDFGIAKAMAGDAHDSLLLTREGQVVGTPEYMSPEQAGVLDADVDTRSDVYALGVVLYELLAGRKPHRFTQGTRDELQRVLSEGPPVRPSTAVDGPRPGRFTPVTAPDGQAWDAIARARQTTPDRLRRLLTGDLDTIVLKAMAFEPSRRYASVDQLAEDIERYLNGQPVLARPDSWAYRARKFVVRHRYAVAGAALAAVALLAFTTMTVLQSARVARERDRAEQALARASAVNRFLVGMFEQADPRQTLGRSLTAEQMLETAAGRLESDLRDEPEVRGELLQSLADVYKQLGRYELSERLNVEAVAMRRSGDPLILADSLDALGDVRRYAGRTDDAEGPLQEALALRLEHRPPTHRDVAESYNNLGLVRYVQGRFADAEALQRKAATIWEALRSTETGDTLVALGLANLGRSIRAQGRTDEAAAILERSLALRQAALPSNNPRIGSSLYLVGLTRADAGRDAEALDLLQQALANRVETLGDAHPQTVQTRAAVARVLARRGRLADATREAEAVLASAARHDNATAEDLVMADLALADVALAAGRSGEARERLERARTRLEGQAVPVPLLRDLDGLATRSRGTP